MTRIILHLDLDAFFCSVEATLNPSLRGKAFAVGGKPDERGVVASASYEAREYGIRSAMPMSQAVRLYPRLLIVDGRHDDYSKVSKQVMERLHQLTPLVEQISIDEAFTDITGLGDPPGEIARRLQTGIRTEMGLPSSIGIAASKMVAKIATEVGKKAAKGAGPPFGLTIVPTGEEAAFLAPLPAEMLWGVGPKTSARLTELGMRTIGDIAKWPESEMIRMFGENGRELAHHARGVDDRPISTEREVKSISQETTFSRDVRDDKALEKTLRELAGQVAQSLRKNNLAGSTVKLKLRWPDFTTLTRQTTLANPTDQDEEISKVALELMKNVRRNHQAVRLIGVAASGLGPPIRQLGLWDVGTEKSRRLQEAVDGLREKYGDQVIGHGNSA